MPQKSDLRQIPVVKLVVHFVEFILIELFESAQVCESVVSGHAGVDARDHSAYCVWDPVQADSASLVWQPVELYPGPGCCRVFQVEAHV